MRRATALTLAAPPAAALLLAALTWAGMQALPPSLKEVVGSDEPQLLDRNGAPLTITYQNAWNIHNRRPLHAIPPFLQRAFVLAEDKRFYEHPGIDWRARFSALKQNLMAARVVRGASTISEQVVRMLHPRPRTYWSRWLEGWEAERLESQVSKADILEFYFNQVPYAARRRGVVEAANYWFDRDLDTLNRKEMLALAVLVRAPSYLDPRRHPAALDASIERLLARATEDGAFSRSDAELIRGEKLALAPVPEPGNAKAAVAAIFDMARTQGAPENSRQLHTTLDASLQSTAERILRERLGGLEKQNVYNAALLLVDHQSDEVLAWVNVSRGEGRDSHWYDAVTQPRQPGSALKPLLYALALERGWTAATLIDDSPLSEMVVGGLHSYHNYSRSYYGPVRLRDALGNSLNIPAVRAIQQVGTGEFLSVLKSLGVSSLKQHPNYYGDGLALGNGEVTLWELVGAYATLARGGTYRPLKIVIDHSAAVRSRVFSPETTGIIADILSDPEARRLEFGSGGLMKFPVETAIKTGTSSDYRDAWALAFTSRYTAGAWMGNLNGRPMDNITGARGPVLVLRSLFAELARLTPTRPLSRSPLLKRVRICLEDGRRASGECPSRDELFVAGTEPGPEPLVSTTTNTALRLRRPHNGLRLAMDPRIPDESEAFPFRLDNFPVESSVVWYVDGEPVAKGETADYLWPMRKGNHTASAEVTTGSGAVVRVPRVSFLVK